MRKEIISVTREPGKNKFIVETKHLGVTRKEEMTIEEFMLQILRAMDYFDKSIRGITSFLDQNVGRGAGN